MIVDLLRYRAVTQLVICVTRTRALRLRLHGYTRFVTVVQLLLRAFVICALRFYGYVPGYVCTFGLIAFVGFTFTFTRIRCCYAFVAVVGLLILRSWLVAHVVAHTLILRVTHVVYTHVYARFDCRALRFTFTVTLCGRWIGFLRLFWTRTHCCLDCCVTLLRYRCRCTFAIYVCDLFTRDAVGWLRLHTVRFTHVIPFTVDLHTLRLRLHAQR